MDLFNQKQQTLLLYFCVLVVASFLLQSFLILPTGDDLSIYYFGTQNSPLDLAKQCYHNTHGRVFSHYLIAATTGMLGFFYSAGLISFLIYISIFCLIYFFIKHFFVLSKRNTLLYATLACVTFLIIHVKPSQTLFWYSVILNYTAPYVIFLVNMFIIVRTQRTKLFSLPFLIFSLSVFSLSVLQQLMSEVATIMIGALYSFLVLNAFLNKQSKQKKTLLTLCLLGAALGAALSATAPGHDVRAELLFASSTQRNLLSMMNVSFSRLFDTIIRQMANPLYWLIIYFICTTQKTLQLKIFRISPLLFLFGLFIFIELVLLLPLASHGVPMPKRSANSLGIGIFMLICIFFYSNPISFHRLRFQNRLKKTLKILSTLSLLVFGSLQIFNTFGAIQYRWKTEKNYRKISRDCKSKSTSSLSIHVSHVPKNVYWDISHGNQYGYRRDLMNILCQANQPKKELYINGSLAPY